MYYRMTHVLRFLAVSSLVILGIIALVVAIALKPAWVATGCLVLICMVFSFFIGCFIWEVTR